MNRNIKIARELVKIARTLIASHENFGHYSIDFDDAKRTFTVYFILKDDAVESDALKNAKACRYEIKSVLEKDDLIEVTNIENNHRSFCFTIVVEKEEKEDNVKKSSFNRMRILVADGEDDDGGGDDVAGGDDDSGDDDGGSMDFGNDDSDNDSGDDSGDEDSKEEEKIDPEEAKRFKNVQDTVKKICKKYNWDTEK